jgi:hypothetical protein
MPIRPPLPRDNVAGTCIPFIEAWIFLNVITAEGKHIPHQKKFTNELASSLVVCDVKLGKGDKSLVGNDCTVLEIDKIK